MICCWAPRCHEFGFATAEGRRELSTSSTWDWPDLGESQQALLGVALGAEACRQAKRCLHGLLMPFLSCPQRTHTIRGCPSFTEPLMLTCKSGIMVSWWMLQVLGVGKLLVAQNNLINCNVAVSKTGLEVCFCGGLTTFVGQQRPVPLTVGSPRAGRACRDLDREQSLQHCLSHASRLCFWAGNELSSITYYMVKCRKEWFFLQHTRFCTAPHMLECWREEVFPSKNRAATPCPFAVYTQAD